MPETTTTHLTHIGGQILRCSLAAVLLFGAGAAWAQETDGPATFTVRMEGRADGQGFAARRRAIEEAQHAVIEAVLQAMTSMKELRPLRPILMRAPQYIQGYDVLRHDQFESYTRVEIDARVLERRLQQDVSALMLPRLPEPPSVLVLLAEQVAPGEPVNLTSSGVGVSELIERLDKVGLEPMASEKIIDHYPAPMLAQACKGDVDPGQVIARSSMAKVVVLGNASTEVQSNEIGSSLNRHKATVTVHIYRGSDGKKVDVRTTTAAVLSVDPKEGGAQAIRDAATKLVQDVTTAAVIAVLGINASDNVLLTVEQPNSEARLDALIQALDADPTVNAVDVLFYSDTLARLKIGYSGHMAHISDYLQARNYHGTELEIRRVIGREMVVTFP